MIKAQLRLDVARAYLEELDELETTEIALATVKIKIRIKRERLRILESMASIKAEPVADLDVRGETP